MSLVTARIHDVRWLWPLLSEHDRCLIEKLSQSLNCSQTVASLLWQRGHRSEAQALSFLNPQSSALHDPYLLADMQQAVARIRVALVKQEGILIHGDYDVDGVTSASLLYLGLKALGFQNLDFFLPNRLVDGYGVSEVALNKAKNEGYSLVITSDCGITAIETVEKANQLGLDVIVTDHHEPKESLPPALAVINPKRKDCLYPFKELAGVGVAFKLLQALGVSDDFWDLVALGTVADVVPLLDENRIFVHQGLSKLAQTSKVGLQALLDVCGLKDKEISSGHIAFQMAPRINAIGRLGDPSDGLRMLIRQDESFAYSVAQKLDDDNQERKVIEKRILDEAHEIIRSHERINKDKVLVVYGPDWHQGVIGIVASRLVEAYYKPVLMIAAPEEGICKASCRSIPNFHLLLGLDACASLLEAYGGHAYAAGFSIRENQIDALQEMINRYANQVLSEEQMCREISIDAEVSFEDLSLELYHDLQHLAPFGAGHVTPIFGTRGVHLVSRPYLVGGSHLRLQVGVGRGRSLTVMAFQMGDQFDDLYATFSAKTALDIVCQIHLNTWQGQTSLQLHLKAWAKH